MTTSGDKREGSLDAPVRHPIAWQSDEFYDDAALFKEMERVFDICHGCRRCFNLCNSFPTLFDAVDASETMEVDSVPKKVYWEVVDNCYLCDMCYMSKCPYVPPHEWNVDFPHLMLRAKAKRFKQDGAPLRDKILSATDTVGKIAGIPVVAGVVNAANRSSSARKVLESTLGVHRHAPVPEYHSTTARKRLRRLNNNTGENAEPTANTRGKVVLYTTCYGNRNRPALNEDLVTVFEHNGIPVALAQKETCCGMPKLELGDLESVEKAKNINVPVLAAWVDKGWDIVAPIPSCTLMYKQELPLMFPHDANVLKVRDAIYDPFEYLMLRHRDGKLKTEFSTSLGKVSYQVACHLRVQNIGFKTRDLLQLIPGTSVELIERCSGHDGTYAVKKEFHDIARKIARPVVNRVNDSQAQYFASDCPMAAEQIARDLDDFDAGHPMNLLRKAYGL
ncbi:MAG TPA: heterodisulfide reductase-related iron-sulfur binding cluster [Woeseiaceae bacterium]|nr:heterodisulfide reductase-related iron-sulfur binding cluster [Woeseiaceae bacterium]